MEILTKDLYLETVAALQKDVLLKFCESEMVYTEANELSYGINADRLVVEPLRHTSLREKRGWSQYSCSWVCSVCIM